MFVRQRNGGGLDTGGSGRSSLGPGDDGGDGYYGGGGSGFGPSCIVFDSGVRERASPNARPGRPPIT